MSKYGVPSRINGKRNPEYWRAYNKTENAKAACRKWAKNHPLAKARFRRRPPVSLKDCSFYSARDEAEAVGSISPDEARQYL